MFMPMDQVKRKIANGSAGELVVGEIYTIIAVHPERGGVFVEGAYRWWHPSRFELVANDPVEVTAQEKD